jgi:molybdenum cofactor synthesis domain-containing protein
MAMVRREGWEPLDLGVVGDDDDAIAAGLDAARGCDAIVTSGGVSVGDRDLVKVVLERRANGTMRWMQVAIKPAKPFAFGTIDDRAVPAFGLPGNPVSAMVSFELFVRPAVRRMAGHRALDRPLVPATATGDLHRRPDGKIHFVRAAATFDGERWRAEPVAGQDSHQLRGMASANALAVLPDGHGANAGEQVDVMLLTAGPAGCVTGGAAG